ncbi:hypothetical protein M885DRAFT_504156 [Pelagophyceae sp. CCMP2097]|nr:hypothetical protein M885DRAFT_504156 [Pelagophyceae sp. CCMP2097]
MLALVGEVGELAEILQWRGEVARGLSDFSDADRAHMAQELSDVLLYLIRLSDVCEIDLPAAVLKKMEGNAAKYPADRARGSAAKYTAYEQPAQPPAPPTA